MVSCTAWLFSQDAMPSSREGSKIECLAAHLNNSVTAFIWCSEDAQLGDTVPAISLQSPEAKEQKARHVDLHCLLVLT